MPDLMPVQHVQCAQMDETQHFGGYVQTGLFNERHWPECTCPKYTYTKPTLNFGGRMVKPPCKHILAAQSAVCQYHSMEDGSPLFEGVCPRCGGPVVPVTVMV